MIMAMHWGPLCNNVHSIIINVDVNMCTNYCPGHHQNGSSPRTTADHQHGCPYYFFVVPGYQFSDHWVLGQEHARREKIKTCQIRNRTSSGYSERVTIETSCRLKLATCSLSKHRNQAPHRKSGTKSPIP